MLSAQALHTTGVYLLPKLRYQFAEFLLLSSLKRLGIFIPSTCVGLRYGLVQLKLRGFSWNHFNHFASYARSCHTLDLRARICLSAIFDTATGTSNTLMIFRDPSPIALYDGAGILTSFPSATHLCLALGADSPCADERCAGNLDLRRGAFHPFIATHVSIRTSDTSSSLYKPPSQAYRTLSYRVHKVHTRSFGLSLSPVTSSAQDDSISELLRFL